MPSVGQTNRLLLYLSLATRPTVTFKVARVAAAWQSCTDAARVTQRVEKSACLCVDWA